MVAVPEVVVLVVVVVVAAVVAVAFGDGCQSIRTLAAGYHCLCIDWPCVCHDESQPQRDSVLSE